MNNAIDNVSPKQLQTRLYYIDKEGITLWYLEDVLGRSWLSSHLAIVWANDNGYFVIPPEPNEHRISEDDLEKIAIQVHESSLTPFNELNAASNVRTLVNEPEQSLEDLMIMYNISVVYDTLPIRPSEWVYEWVATAHGRHGAITARGTGGTPSCAVKAAVATFNRLDKE